LPGETYLYDDGNGNMTYVRYEPSTGAVISNNTGLPVATGGGDPPPAGPVVDTGGTAGGPPTTPGGGGGSGSQPYALPMYPLTEGIGRVGYEGLAHQLSASLLPRDHNVQEYGRWDFGASGGGGGGGGGGNEWPPPPPPPGGEGPINPRQPHVPPGMPPSPMRPPMPPIFLPRDPGGPGAPPPPPAPPFGVPSRTSPTGGLLGGQRGGEVQQGPRFPLPGGGGGGGGGSPGYPRQKSYSEGNPIGLLDTGARSGGSRVNLLPSSGLLQGRTPVNTGAPPAKAAAGGLLGTQHGSFGPTPPAGQTYGGDVTALGASMAAGGAGVPSWAQHTFDNPTEAWQSNWNALPAHLRPAFVIADQGRTTGGGVNALGYLLKDMGYSDSAATYQRALLSGMKTATGQQYAIRDGVLNQIDGSTGKATFNPLATLANATGYMPMLASQSPLYAGWLNAAIAKGG
jgi:hypothetical protein